MTGSTLAAKAQSGLPFPKCVPTITSPIATKNTFTIPAAAPKSVSVPLAATDTYTGKTTGSYLVQLTSVLDLFDPSIGGAVNGLQSKDTHRQTWDINNQIDYTAHLSITYQVTIPNVYTAETMCIPEVSTVIYNPPPQATLPVSVVQGK